MVRVLVCVGLAAAACLAGCSNLVPLDKDVMAVVGPPPRVNTTPMAPALACIRSELHASRRNPRTGVRNPRIGVNDFVDGTGVMEGGTQYSRALTQRPDMMLVVALASAGAQLVNRSSINVAEWEMKQAMEKKLGDGHKQVIDGESVTFRPIRTGVILGSTIYVSGAITELNWNIASGVAEAGAYSAGIGRRTYRISIAIDVMVTDTQTTEIVYAKSYKKQLVGFELNANFFRFVNQDSALQVVSLGTAAAQTATQALELFSANLGEKQNEPTQVALRWVVELAAYDIMRKLTHAGQWCDSLLPPGTFEDSVPPTKHAFPTKAAAAESEAPMERPSKAASGGAPAAEPVVETRSEMPAPEQAKVTPIASTEESSANKGAAAVPEELARLWHKLVAPGQAKVTPSASTEESSAKVAAAEPEAPMERPSKAASISAPATEKPVVEARAAVPAPEQAKVTPSASTEKSSAIEAAAEPEAPMERDSTAASISAPATEKPVVEARAEMTAPEQAKVTPSASTEMSSANGVAPKPKVRTVRDSKAASVKVTATEKKRVVEARAKVPAAKRAETTPSAATEKSSGNAQSLDRRAVSSPKKVAVESKYSKAQNSKAAGVKASAIEKRIADAHAAVAALKQAEAKPSASTKKSSGNSQPQAKSSDGDARVQWMSGSVPVLTPEFSQAGRAGDVQ